MSTLQQNGTGIVVGQHFASIREWYADTDGDGYGDLATPPVLDCHETRPGFTTNGGDCDDAEPEVHPGVDESCNGIDDDCTSGVDDGLADCETSDSPADEFIIRPLGACSATAGSRPPSLVWLAAILAFRRRAVDARGSRSSR